jgi:hypothetical protein
MFDERVLREESTSYVSKNIETMSIMKKIKLHVAVFISWHNKEGLHFYNNEYDMPDTQIKRSRKSRIRKNKSTDEYR